MNKATAVVATVTLGTMLAIGSATGSMAAGNGGHGGGGVGGSHGKIGGTGGGHVVAHAR